MKTQVTETSLNAYRTLENEGRQIDLVAQFLISETKAARAHSIQTIAAYFFKKGNYDLSQTSRVSPRLNTIKNEGYYFKGYHYEAVSRGVEKNPITGRGNEMWVLTIRQQPASNAVQLEMF